MRSKNLFRAVSLCIIAALIVVQANIVFAAEPTPVLISEPVGFSDVTPDHPNYEAIMYLKEKGIIHGYKDGTFKPDAEISRAELLKILVESYGITPDPLVYNQCFIDVEIIEWYPRYVCFGKHEEWVEGYEDDTFRPGNTIINVEALKMILDSQRIYIPPFFDIEFPLSENEIDAWYSHYVWYAVDEAIIEIEDEYDVAKPITRGEACELMYRTLLLVEELTAPVTYTQDNLTFEHTSYFWLDEIASVDGITLFTNEDDDGIAFLTEEQFEMLQTEENIESALVELEGQNSVIEVKKGVVEKVFDYTEYYEEGEGILLFTVEPVSGSNPSYYVLGHYTSDNGRLEVLRMISTIEVN